MSGVKWPERRQDYLTWARALSNLIGGRADVAAIYREFANFKGWGPWKGKRVPDHFTPGPGQQTGVFEDFQSKKKYTHLLNPLSIDNLVTHLRGKNRLGVYVLAPDSRVSFLAADFDDHQGKLQPDEVWNEVKQFIDTCDSHDWIVHVEKSKSGRGYHAWLFFDSPVPAKNVRAIGRWLFEEAQALRDDEDFSTFDRFFPAQSEAPTSGKGYGNLIGLPLFGFKEYEAGRTAWIDPKTGEIIDDPLNYTLNILKFGRNQAARIPEFMKEWDLQPDERRPGSSTPRDPDTPLGSDDEFLAVTSRCKFMQSVADSGGDVSEPLWYSWITQAVRFTGGDDWIQEHSQGHPTYDYNQTKSKIQHARDSSGPHTCETVRDHGFKGCPKGGCQLPGGNPTRAPAGLAAWGSERTQKTKKTNRSVKVSEAEVVTSPAAPEFDETEPEWNLVPNWEIDKRGVIDKNSNSFICLRPLWVHALTVNTLGQWGVQIKFYDFNWMLKMYAFPRDRMHETGGVLGRELALLGLPVMPGKEKFVSRFLVLQEGFVEKRILAATRLGWFDSPDSPAVFVLPEQPLGSEPDKIVYQPDTPTHTAETLHQSGELKEWQAHVAKPCGGNPILMFSIMLGLAGPLLKLVQEQSGGFHLYGVTTGGKTTAAQCAASVWGCGADPQEGPDSTSIRKWHATGNALEATAEVHNDTILTLDEIGEADPYELGKIIYQLAGGLSKGRSTAGGGLRSTKTWRLLFFSTGEKSVKQMLSTGGHAEKGGQRVRLPDIPADDNDTGERAIILSTGRKDPKTFVQDLKRSCARYYGSAGPAFVQVLIHEAHRVGIHTLTGQLRGELRDVETALWSDINEQLPAEGGRVLRRFALVAQAGCRASQAGILPWSIDAIIQAVRDVRDRWLSDLGQERSEIDRAIAHLRDQLVRHQDRFRWLSDDGSTKQQPQRDLLGYRVNGYFLLLEKGIIELSGEHDHRTLLRALRSRGFLWPSSERLVRRSPRIEEFNNARVWMYWIKNSFLGDEISDNTEEDDAISNIKDLWSGATSNIPPTAPPLPDSDPGFDDDPGDDDLPYGKD